MVKYIIAVVIIVAAIAGLVYLADNGTTVKNVESVEVVIAALSDSGVSGSAMLKAQEGQTLVSLSLVGANASTTQPVHIHQGSCAELGDVAYPLTNVEAGASETVIDVPLMDLLAGLPLAINIHKSVEDQATYLACGDIMMPTDEMMDNKKDGTDLKGDDAMMEDGTMNNSSSTDSIMGDDAAMMDKTEAVVVTYGAKGFSPASVEVSVGATVKFVNDSGEKMWVASNPHPIHTDLSGFDQKTGVSKGGNYEYTFTKAGTWGYHNHLNSAVLGEVVVK